MTDDANLRAAIDELDKLRPNRKPWLATIGQIFRFLFILAVGLTIQHNTPSLGDRQIGSLTLNELGPMILGLLLVLGCVKWFFSFPPESGAETWGAFGILTSIVIALVVVYLTH